MILSIENLYKYYDGEPLLKDVNVTVEDKDRIGLVGRNGCGKTTLLRIINGLETLDKTPDGKGSVNISNKIAVGYLQQNSGLESSNTIEEEMRKPFARLDSMLERMKQLERSMPSLSGKELEESSEEYAALAAYYEAAEGYHRDVKINSVLNGMGFGDKPKDMIVDSLSGGEKTRLAMAKLLLEEPDLLILDEPTNHLDLQTLMWLEDHLRKYRGAVIIVSHDRYFLDKLCSRIWEISAGRLYSYKGNYTEYVRQKELRDLTSSREYEAQQKEIAKLEEFIEKNKVRASTAARAKSRQKQLDKMEILEKPQLFERPPKIRLEYDIDPPKEVLEVSGCEIAVGEGDKRKLLVEDFGLSVRRGEKVGIIGVNGAGKTSALKLIQGLVPHEKGRIKWANNVKISYFEQENTTLDPNSPVLDEVRKRYPLLAEQQIRKTLASVLLTGENVYRPTGVISGGERAKLCFALMMLRRGNVLVLDEPTNHLDLETKEVLEQALEEFGGTIIFVSHDRYLLNRIADRIVEIKDGKTTAYKGNFDAYLEQKNAKTAQLAADVPKKNNGAGQTQHRTREQRAEAAKRRQQVKELEEEIESLERQIAQLELEITLPEVTGDHLLLSSKCLSLQEAKEQLNEKMDLWAELA